MRLTKETSSLPRATARLARAAGFSLVEVTIAAALISLCATFGYAALLNSNRTAVVNRLYTLAQEMARDQVDRIQCASPYNPQLNPPQVPPELALGTSALTKPLYFDPMRSTTVLNATLTTTVTDAGDYNARVATVTVQYSFRGRTYTVQMNTLRTSDS